MRLLLRERKHYYLRMPWPLTRRVPSIQFSLRTVLALLTVACVLLGRKVDYYRRQSAAIVQLQEAGASVVVRRQVPEWSDNLSGGRLRYVCAIDWRRTRGAALNEPLENLGTNPWGKLSDIELYFVWADFHVRPMECVAQLEHILPAISECRDCTALSFAGAPVRDDQLNALVQLRNTLRVLDLSKSHVTNDGLTHLQRLRHLEWLFVANTDVTPDAARALVAKLLQLSIDILNAD